MNAGLRGGRNIPLGKNCTQLEMTNPETRSLLKNFLEQQIREK